MNRCKESLTAKVSLKRPDDLDWSHILGDGEQAKLPAPPTSFTGGLPVSDASLFVKVKLQETQGNNVNFTVRKLINNDSTKPYLTQLYNFNSKAINPIVVNYICLTLCFQT